MSHFAGRANSPTIDLKLFRASFLYPNERLKDGASLFRRHSFILREPSVPCTCENGEAATGVDCVIDGAANCASCSSGFNLQSDACVENVCTCESGTGATGSDCPTDGDAKCVSCNPAGTQEYTGYELIGETCSQKKVYVQMMFEQGSDISQDKTVWTITASTGKTCTIEFQMSRSWVEGTDARTHSGPE